MTWASPPQTLYFTSDIIKIFYSIILYFETVSTWDAAHLSHRHARLKDRSKRSQTVHNNYWHTTIKSSLCIEICSQHSMQGMHTLLYNQHDLTPPLIIRTLQLSACVTLPSSRLSKFLVPAYGWQLKSLTWQVDCCLHKHTE